MVQAQNQRADFFVAAAAVDLDQVLDGEGKFIFAGVMRLKLFVQRFVGELAGFAFVEDGELRVEAKFVKMLADELEAKTVERADVREIETRELFRPEIFVRATRRFFLPAFCGGAGASRRRRPR